MLKKNLLFLLNFILSSYLLISYYYQYYTFPYFYMKEFKYNMILVLLNICILFIFVYNIFLFSFFKIKTEKNQMIFLLYSFGITVSLGIIYHIYLNVILDKYYHQINEREREKFRNFQSLKFYPELEEQFCNKNIPWKNNILNCTLKNCPKEEFFCKKNNNCNLQSEIINYLNDSNNFDFNGNNQIKTQVSTTLQCLKKCSCDNIY